jgi:ABC-2 type transport system permease protein
VNSTLNVVIFFGAEVRRTIRLVRSYWVEYVSDFITYGLGFLVLMGVFWSASDDFGPNVYLSSLIGYIIWKMCASIMADISDIPSEEARTGTLEQLLLSGRSPGLVFLARTVAFILEYGIRSFLLGLSLALLGGVLHPVSFLALGIFLLTMIGAIGLGFALAGIGFIYKQINRLTILIWQMLVFFTGALAPIYNPVFLGISKGLPLTWGIMALRAIFIDQASLLLLWQNGMLIGLLINTGVYVLLGVILFSWGQSRARSLGTLAHY